VSISLALFPISNKPTPRLADNTAEKDRVQTVVDRLETAVHTGGSVLLNPLRRAIWIAAENRDPDA
jgi:hypothetical protein